MPFLLSFLGGAIFTPFGEEILFRGVVANALNRYGVFAGVVLSSIIFGLVHGVSVILHCVYNAMNSIASAVGFAPMQ
ncbi:CPBP family intramembrane glutamic endopeptidase [Rhizobium leguminosarum]|uniref:CPBP family intramembrane glutamic endopeptidase n=1 Tax=Rhizobium leguminosarum TaxID=384 RepID=UPI001FDEBE40|nr:CPBP family intramembrane glutamic endopeptidase [Rhizobium leguminosarum]